MTSTIIMIILSISKLNKIIENIIISIQEFVIGNKKVNLYIGNKRHAKEIP